MTTPNLDPEAIAKKMEEFAERRTDVLDTIEASKGVQYAAALAVVVSTAGTLRTTNSLICGEIPELIVDQVMDMQARMVRQLEDFAINQLFPVGQDLGTLMRQMIEAKEFRKNVETLSTQREQAEIELNRVMQGK